MDVLALEHNFGKEIETSIQQLFNYFCNNLNLGQWQAAKACLHQLNAYKKNFQFDLDTFLLDIIQNPQLYSHGLQTIQSPYHLAVLLYDFCTNAQLIPNQTEQFYDKILFKFIIYSFVNTEADLNLTKLCIDELTNYMNPLYSNDLTPTSFDCLISYFIDYPSKIEHVLKLIFKYNPTSEHFFLKVNLAAVNTCVEKLNQTSSLDTLSSLINILLIYEFKTNDLELENKKYESIALIQRTFKEICTKFNQLWFDDLNKLEENYRRIYTCLVDEPSEFKTDLLNLFCKTNYQIERIQLIRSTFNDESLPVLSIIKKYSKDSSFIWHRLFLYCYYEKKILIKCVIDECLQLISQNQFDNLVVMLSVKEFLNARPLILLMGISQVQDLQSAKKLISCLCLNSDKGSLVDKIGNLLKTHLDFAAWFLAIKKENRKRDILFSDLIRLLHRKLPLNIISHYIDLNTLDNEQMIKILRNTLTDTGTDEKTKWVRFIDEVNEKISLLQENCLAIYEGFYCLSEVLNAILFCCESFNSKMAQVASDAMTNMETQEDVKRYKRSSTSTYLSFRTIGAQDNKSNKSLVSLYDVENEYKKNVIDKFERVKVIVSKIMPLNYRLELLENIYSLIYLSLNDFKDTEDESDDDQDELKSSNNNNNSNSNDPLSNSEMNGDQIDFVSQSETAIVYSHEDSEFSIYGTTASNNHRTTRLSSKEDIGNLSSKSYNKQDSCCSNASSNQSRKHYANIYYYETDNESKTGKKKKFINLDRRNTGGGNSFLCNDFLCRDILILVKDLLQPFKSLNKTDNQTETQLLNSSITTQHDLVKRSGKLAHIINETLWRLQLVKCDLFQIEYGKINVILFDSTSTQAINESQETLVYDLMKTRKRAASSMSSVGSRTKSNRSRVNTIISKDNEQRRSFESQRSLSLITPISQSKYNNQTVMKLLSSIETLSSLCLKESKQSEANQLVKMYASNKEACDTFEFRQIIFDSIYQKLIDDLNELDLKASMSKNLNLIEQSLTSLDLVKLTENILLLEKENNLLQCLFLCDLITTTKLSLKLSSDLADYAQLKLNLVKNNEMGNKTDADMKLKMGLFIEGAKMIASHLSQQYSSLKMSLIDYLFKFNGIYLDINESMNRQACEISIKKFESFNQLSTQLDAWKTKFENYATLDDQNQLKQTEIYNSIMNTINELICVTKSEDIISTYFYDPNQFNRQPTTDNTEMNTMEKLIYKTVNDSSKPKKKSSNYLLSFYEYCKTLFDYFKENNAITLTGHNSCFSILNSSPASLICKLLFEDSIKPYLIESLTKKLNLNLTAIILHNSCPRLKLNSSSNKRNKKSLSLDYLLNTENNFYSLNSFYTILNENDLSYCSKKKPDQFLRDLLFKLLKYCKNYTNKRVIDLATAKEIYESAEFKSILNESQELQHLNLFFLKTDNQKLSFFINLYNLLCIHAHFYLASFIKLDDDSKGVLFPDDLFNNKTEKLLFQQRMSYKVGQMGCVSLYDLKHLVLMRSFFNKFTQPVNSLTNMKKKTQLSQLSSLTNSPVSKSTLSEHLDLESDNQEPLYKYSYFKLDLDAEPLWIKSYLPNETKCDYRILFALTNCSESDPPICVYDSDNMFDDQLQMQMSLFLNDSIHADLCEDVLYLPSFLIDNYSLFIKSDYANRKTELEHFIRFLIDNIQGDLKDNLKGLLELEPEGFSGENIDEFGRRELSFPIEKIPKSKKFSLVIDYDSTHKNPSWYKSQINLILKQHEDERNKKLASRTRINRSISQTSDQPTTNEENIDIKMEILDEDLQLKQKLNQDCLDYINKSSPLISNSLSFLFDNAKRDLFFQNLNESSENSLNRFIQLYVPLDYMSHLCMQTKLNLITQFLLTNKTEESKIELIIDLANYYALKQEWNLVFNLLNNCTQDNEELIDTTNETRLNRKSSLKSCSPNNEFDFDLDNKDVDKLTNDINVNNNGRYSRKDLYNLYDHACICQAYQEAKSNEKSYVHLMKIKNFIRQIRAIFGLMHLWSVESCLELIEYCLAKAKLYQEPTSVDVALETSSQVILMDQMFTDFDLMDNLIQILIERKNELTAYQELTKYARSTLEKYYEHQQMQDAAGFYENKSDQQQQDETNLSKIKKCCQKCLTWQFAKKQLESTTIDEETNDLIMDLFLMNDHFTSAKYLIKKLNLNNKLKFKLDFGHLKYRLLNLNVSSSIIVIDLDAILTECVSFKDDAINNDYMFEICFKLLNELKDLKELNNQVLISLSEYLLDNYRRLLSEQQTKELKTIQLTARIFQILVQELKDDFDSYKRHHSQPLLIIEQLLMNSHIDLCSKAIRICRDYFNDSQLNTNINLLLVNYAIKALEFKVLKNKKETNLDLNESLTNVKSSKTSQQSIKINANKKSTSSSIAIIPLSTSSPNYSILSQSVKNSSKLTSDTGNFSSSFNSNSTLFNSNNNGIKSGFIMPNQPPPKEEWVKDEDVNECMVCNTRRFTLLNRRHHCRRCGRVVCSDCAKNMTLVDNILSRTCDDCFKQLEQQKLNEKRLLDIELGEKNLFLSKKLIKSNVGQQSSLTSGQKGVGLVDNDDLPVIDEVVDQVWQLIGGNDNETSKRRDEEIRSLFRYLQAPSTSLCLSILDLHDQPLECVKNLLNMCDILSSCLQSTNYQVKLKLYSFSAYYQNISNIDLLICIIIDIDVEDFGLILNMIKHLLHNAKVKLLQNSSSNMISLCDTYLSLIDVLEQLLLDNCSNIPSLYELKNTETVRRFRNRLLEEERHELAMNISTKCGLDSQTVWASWGLTELRRGNYKEARNKFEKCMKSVQDKHTSISSAQFKILTDLVSYLENAPPANKLTTLTLLTPLQNVRSLIAEPKLPPNSNSSILDDTHLNECVYYLETYGNYSMLASFYQRHGYIERAFQYIYENKCKADIFVESLLVPSLRTGEFYHLIDYMLSLERIQHKLTTYYGAVGKYLEKNAFLNTLYDFQILMKDYVRACMSCICFFTRHCQNYSDLFLNLHYLNKARKHLEDYLEISSLKEFGSNSQLNSKQNSLCKQFTAQEVDNYLNAINLQIEVTKFINNCSMNKKEQLVNQKATFTVFGNNDTKINLCCSILLSGDSIQEGFGFVIRIIQCFKLSPTLVYSQIARELAKQYNFKEIHNLLKCINESGYEDHINSSCYDECIATCIRVLSAENNSRTTQDKNLNAQAQQQLEKQQQQYNKEIEELIKLMKDDENRINAFILNGRLKSAYLIAIKKERVDIVKHIANAADRAGQNLIKDICNKWLEKKQSQQQ